MIKSNGLGGRVSAAALLLLTPAVTAYDLPIND
jgi:hypothetical protein